MTDSINYAILILEHYKLTTKRQTQRKLGAQSYGSNAAQTAMIARLPKVVLTFNRLGMIPGLFLF